MIVIYEQDDLTEAARRRPRMPDGTLPLLADVDPDLQSAAGFAHTVYVARTDGSIAGEGRLQMIKARNAPLDPYPVKIKVERDINV
jgi:hypothetical protein